MKRSTAIRHLVELGAAADEGKAHRELIDWPLEEMWVAGELLDPVDDLDFGTVVLVLDIPAPELPWLALHPTGEWVGHRMRLGKRPLSWFYRPATGSPWTPDHRRVARFWSASDGLDEDLIDALREKRSMGVVEPNVHEWRDGLSTELQVCRDRLRSVLDRYWDDRWRRAHRDGTTPEDHLWRAAQAVIDIETALDDAR